VTIEIGELRSYFRRTKKVETKFIFFDDDGNNKILYWLLLSLACWLMLTRKLCVYNAGLKFDMTREILTVVMISYYENVHSCKRHTVVRCVFYFWWFALLFLGLATHYRESWFSNMWSLSNFVKMHLWLQKLINSIPIIVIISCFQKGLIKVID